MLRICLHTLVRKSGSLLKHVGSGLQAVSHRIYHKPLSIRDTNILRWYADNSEHDLRYEFDLFPDDIVFDVGGFHGDWAAEIAARYGCQIHVFEPVSDFLAGLRRRFGRNPRITIHPFGLAASDTTELISLMSESSSVLRPTSEYHAHPKSEAIRLRNINDFLAQLGNPSIAVMKINIEGGEYELLESLIDSGLIVCVGNLLVQFHDFVQDANNRVTAIRNRLAATHNQTFVYDFVWENWARK